MIKKMSILACAAIYLTACTTTDPYTGQQKTSNLAGGAVLGAALGAVGGAVIGGGGRDSRNGALIGAGIQSGFGDDFLRLIGVEWCPDCSTSGRTAAYWDPYLGTPVPGEPVPNTGMLLYEKEI